MIKLYQAFEWCMSRSPTWAFGVGPRAEGHALWLRVGERSVELPLPMTRPRDWGMLLVRLASILRERDAARMRSPDPPLLP
jgi:hypothetical protein